MIMTRPVASGLSTRMSLGLRKTIIADIAAIKSTLETGTPIGDNETRQAIEIAEILDRVMIEIENVQ